MMIFLKAIIFLNLLGLSTLAQALCTKSKKVNFRYGPGLSYKKTWTVSKYMPLKKISESKSWYRVKDFEGDYHWVAKHLVSDKYKCAVVKNIWASLRVGPGKQFKRNKKYPRAEKYASFKYISKKNQWIKVKDKNIYWVHSDLVWVQ